MIKLRVILFATCSFLLVSSTLFAAFPGQNGKIVFERAGGGISIMNADVKFSLGGNQGMSILAAGSPASQTIQCDTSAPISDIEETVTAGGSSLSYDVVSDRYNYVWKTSKVWANSCRRLVLTFNDGTVKTADFSFAK